MKCIVVWEARRFAAATEAGWRGLCEGMGLVSTGGSYLYTSLPTNLIRRLAML